MRTHAPQSITRSRPARPLPTPPRTGAAFRPCIDIHRGVVKQIVGSTLTDEDGGAASSSSSLATNFESALPAAFYARLYSNSHLPGGHVIMLGADPASKAAATEALMHYPGGMHVGGGVNAGNAAGWLDAGASHVIVTSAVFRDGALDTGALKELVETVGKQHLVLDLSCRRREPGGPFYVMTDRWQKWTTLTVNEPTLTALSASCAEFLVHAVDVEGKKGGVDADLVALLGVACPLPVTYAGGAASLADLDAVATAGKGRVDVTVGSALDIFGGGVPFREVVAWHRAQQAS